MFYGEFREKRTRQARGAKGGRKWPDKAGRGWPTASDQEGEGGRWSRDFF